MGRALEHLGFRASQCIVNNIMRRLSDSGIGDCGGSVTDSGAVIQRRDFDFMLNRLRLAELFTPTSGFFQFASTGNFGDEVFDLKIVDYVVECCQVSEVSSGEAAMQFFFRSQRPLEESGSVSVVLASLIRPQELNWMR